MKGIFIPTSNTNLRMQQIGPDETQPLLQMKQSGFRSKLPILLVFAFIAAIVCAVVLVAAPEGGDASIANQAKTFFEEEQIDEDR